MITEQLKAMPIKSNPWLDSDKAKRRVIMPDNAGKRIAKARVERNYSVNDVAMELSIRSSVLRSLERGSEVLTPEQFHQIEGLYHELKTWKYPGIFYFDSNQHISLTQLANYYDVEATTVRSSMDRIQKKLKKRGEPIPERARFDNQDLGDTYYEKKYGFRPSIEMDLYLQGLISEDQFGVISEFETNPIYKLDRWYSLMCSQYEKRSNTPDSIQWRRFWTYFDEGYVQASKGTVSLNESHLVYRLRKHYFPEDIFNKNESVKTVEITQQVLPYYRCGILKHQILSDDDVCQHFNREEIDRMFEELEKEFLLTEDYR